MSDWSNNIPRHPRALPLKKIRGKECPRCDGLGRNKLFYYEYADDTCEVCNGTGKRP